MLRVSSLFFLVFSSLSVYAQVTQLNARVDKNPAMLDETIVLTVEAIGDADRNAFDSAVLLRDFIVGRTSVSSQTSIVNGAISKQTVWSTALTARNTGSFTIPSFTVEGVSSSPITLTIIEPSYKNNSANQDYYVQTSLSTERAYVQQQLVYSVKLYMADNIERGSIQAPVLENADIQPIGEDRQYSEIVDGRRYQVVERNFSLIPQQSGEVNIRGAVFTGEVLAPNTNLRFGLFNRTKQITRAGQDLTLKVLPIPSGIDYDWLPSEQVMIHEEWSSDEFVVGEPVTRTITLTALSVREEQLPDIAPMYPPQFKQYPDQPTTATAERDNRIIAQRVQSIALIPTQAGRLVLPEVSIPWFDVTTGKTAYAKLPARTVNITEGAAASTVPAVTPAVDAVTPAPPPVAPALSPAPVSVDASFNLWTWLFAILWCLTLLLLIWQRYSQRSSRPESASEMPTLAHNEQQAWQQIARVAKGGSPTHLYAAIAAWLSIVTGVDRRSVRADDSPLTASLQPLVDKLLASRYGTAHTEQDIASLLKQLDVVRQAYLQSDKKNTELPSLYS